MKRKRKAVKRKRRTPIKLLLNGLSLKIGKRIDFLVQEVEQQYREIAMLRDGITLLLQTHERHHAQAIAVHMENARLRDGIKDPADAAPPA
jgi:hypothetical protein